MTAVVVGRVVVVGVGDEMEMEVCRWSGKSPPPPRVSVTRAAASAESNPFTLATWCEGGGRTMRASDMAETRSSAQGNCSAKSLAGNVADSSLSSLSSRGGGVGGVQGQGVGEGG